MTSPPPAGQNIPACLLHVQYVSKKLNILCSMGKKNSFLPRHLEMTCFRPVMSIPRYFYLKLLYQGNLISVNA